MRRQALIVLVTLVMALGSGCASAWADTSATCTTDTATAYCEQLPSGTNAEASASGFVIMETTMGVLLGLTFTYIVLRKVFAAAGWGSW